MELAEDAAIDFPFRRRTRPDWDRSAVRDVSRGTCFVGQHVHRSSQVGHDDILLIDTEESKGDRFDRSTMEAALTMERVTPCRNCGERDHTSIRCPELSAPLHQQGIQKPAGPPPRGGGDDESAKKVDLVITVPHKSQTQKRL